MVDYPFATTDRSSINIDRKTKGFDSGWLLSEMHRATGSVNFPQLLNRLETKTGQVRNLMFRREAIGNKEFRTTKSDNSTSLAGPGVSFGYEDGTNTTTNTTGTAPTGGLAGSLGVNKTYHNKYPELNLFPIKALQTPITSYGGTQGKAGYIEQGTCKFYMPSRGYLRNYVQFQNEFRFRQIEPQDILIDVDRVSWTFPQSNSDGVGEMPQPTVYPSSLFGGDTTPRTNRIWTDGAGLSTLADKGLAGAGNSGGFSWYGPSSASTTYGGASNVVVGADCKRLRAVMKANYGKIYDHNYDELGPGHGGVATNTIGKTYTWDDTYSGETNLRWKTGNGNERSYDTVLSTVGLVCLFMLITIPDDASVSNSGTSYENRAANDKARTHSNYRTVYGHWTFTAPDDAFFEQTHRSSGSFGGDGYMSKMDFIQFPVNEPVVIDLPFYDVEVGDTRTLHISGREYIATFGASTRAPGIYFSSSSGGNNTATSRWSDGTQTETDAGQVGASWDIDRVIYTENIGGASTDAGGMDRVNFMFCTTRGVYGYDYYTQFGTDGNQPDGKVGIPLYKTTTVNNTSAATSTITITDFTELNAGDKVNLVATDGTNYDFVQGDQSSVAGTFEATTSNNQTATNLMNVINTSSGPSGTRFTATVDGAVVTATQATGGTDGNTTVTLTDTGTAGMSKTNFTGGTANTYAVGTTEIAVDDFGSSMRDGSPLFTSSFEYLGNIASTLDVTNQWSVTLEAPGTLYTVEDGEQLYGYPQSGVDHWCQDIIDGVPELVMEELYLYEDAEWVVNSIKDYKDEYQEVRCSKVRGKRHSRRFAHG